MTGKPIEIKLDADTRGAEAGAERVADALGNVEDALDDVTAAGKDDARVLDDIADKSGDAATALDRVDDAATDSARALDDVADKSKDAASELDRVGDGARALDDVADKSTDAASGLERVGDAADDAARQAGTLDRDFTAALDNVADEARKAGDDIGDGVRNGVDRAGDGLNDFKDEAAGTAREGAAAFTGSWDDVGGVVQETLANAFAGFGPVGAAAGVAAAVGFGVLYTKIREEAEQSEERVDAMFDSFLESEGKYLGDSYVLEQMQAIAQGTEDAAATYEELQAIATATGRDLKDVTREFINGTLDYDAALSDVGKQINRNGGQLTTEGQIFNKTNRDAIAALRRRRDEVGRGTDEWSKFNRVGGADLHKRINVDDNGSARSTQREINGIRGKSVPVYAYVPQSSINDVYNTVAGIRLPALTVQVRYGQAAV